MLISQKTKYSLRGLFELAARNTQEPVKVSELAKTQNLPERFLEVIFAELKQAGIVESRRGNEGGYLLARPASDITVGEIIRFIQGPTGNHRGNEKADNAVFGDYAFGKLWDNIERVVSEIYDETTLSELVQEEIEYRHRYAPNYAI